MNTYYMLVDEEDSSILTAWRSQYMTLEGRVETVYLVLTPLQGISSCSAMLNLGSCGPV